MSLTTEKRLLQLFVGLACLVPLMAGGVGVILGAAWLAGNASVEPDLDSHFRYISGVFLGVGLGFASCVRCIETKTRRIRMLAAFVVLGGFARLWSVFDVGWPGAGMRFGLVMELVVVPFLVLWQTRLSKRWYRAP